MTEITASTLLAEMKPAWRAALGDRVSHEYVAGFVRRNRGRLEAALAPIVAAMNAVPEVHVVEPAPKSEARDTARSTRLRSAATNLAHRRVQVAADSIAKLRHQDVERVLQETPADERRQVAYVLADLRPELAVEIDEVMREVLGEPGSWSEYGRQEIYEPGARTRRERTAAEDALLEAEVVPPQWSSRTALVAAEFEFDGTKCTIFVRPPGYRVRVAEGGLELELDTVDGSDLQAQAKSRLSSLLDTNPSVALLDQALHDSIRQQQRWKADRLVYVFSLAGRRIADRRLSEAEPTSAAERAIEAAAPMIAEAEQEIAAAKGEPRHVVMASLEAGGIILLSPLGYIGGDLFQTYRDDTSRLQYVSYPKKGNRGIPKAVARAVLALERDGFEVRAETPEVVKSLIVTGGLDHALPVGPPPPRAQREDPARPPTRTSDLSLIARVTALAEDPPTSTLKYLVKTLRERGDLPLQVKDWKEGGWRPVETAIEEAEGKAARKLARKPKAERLRADGVERPAKDANEEHAAQALVQLANMDPDKARDVNEAGFSKSDVATGHTLARRWEATGELTGDEWDWAVAVANKYRRQVGPLPEPKGKGTRQRSSASGTSAEERLFVGVMPTGIVYADRSREVDGDYARCAFLPFDTLALDVAPKCPAELLTLIKPDAARMIAKRGERFQISASGQAIVLGSRFADPVVPKANSDKKGNNPLSYAGHSLATVQDIAAFLRRSLGKLYERYMLNINVVRNVGDHSVMLTFYRVFPDASELDAANAKCQVRINIHGAGRTNGSTWPDDATPAELTAYTVWAHNAPKFRKRTGPPSVIVAAVSSWFVLNIADLTGSSTPTQGGRLRDIQIDDMDAQVAREEAAMGNALRAERDREEAEWSGAVRRGVKAEIANGHDAETAKRIAVANLGKDFEYYDKRSEEQWGERP